MLRLNIKWTVTRYYSSNIICLSENSAFVQYVKTLRLTDVVVIYEHTETWGRLGRGGACAGPADAAQRPRLVRCWRARCACFDKSLLDSSNNCFTFNLRHPFLEHYNFNLFIFIVVNIVHAILIHNCCNLHKLWLMYSTNSFQIISINIT